MPYVVNVPDLTSLVEWYVTRFVAMNGYQPGMGCNEIGYVLKSIVSFANMDNDQRFPCFTNNAKCMLILSKKPKYFIKSSLPTDHY